MSDNSEANIATADALTLLLHNQHAMCAAIEEVTKWLSENGAGALPLTQLRPWKRWTGMLKTSQAQSCDSGSYRYALADTRTFKFICPFRLISDTHSATVLVEHPN